MTDDIKELKELIEKNTKLAEDTNLTVHKMRRSALWGRALQLIWWAAIIGVSGAAYYIYLRPYVGQIEYLYEQFKTIGQYVGQIEDLHEQFKTIGQQVQDFLQIFGTTPR
jgi:uncharacterized membrane protein